MQKPVPKKQQQSAISFVYIKENNAAGSSGDINSREIPDNLASPFPINRIATKSPVSKIIEENLSPKEAFHQKRNSFWKISNSILHRISRQEI